MKLDELTQKWLRKKKHEVQDVTYKAYVHLIKTHILPFWSNAN
ncbi:hypothetical protein [Piscibacillus salipiscarius]|nr:hypothetical protein [Piscibacillus salipiscarius]